MNEGRIFRILFHLLENDRATAPELAKELGVSVRTNALANWVASISS